MVSLEIEPDLAANRWAARRQGESLVIQHRGPNVGDSQNGRGRRVVGNAVSDIAAYIDAGPVVALRRNGARSLEEPSDWARRNFATAEAIVDAGADNVVADCAGMC